jgi:DNA-binding transcriptional LysR family regulator
MELQELKGFHAVVKYNNFTIAAKKLHRTQPTISLQIKSLEEELGVRLFERLGSKKVKLTREGELFFKLSQSLLEELETIKTRFNEELGDFGFSTVKIATHSSVMVYQLPSVIKTFKKKYPTCKLTIYHRSLDEIHSMVEKGEVDFGISSHNRLPKNLEYKMFSKVNRLLIGSKHHPLASKKVINLEELAKYPLILPVKGTNTRRLVDEVFKQHNLNYNLAMEVVGRDAIKTYASMNFGVSILSSYFISEEDKNKLFVRNLSNYFGQSEMGLVFRKGKHFSTTAEEFMGILMAEKSIGKN